MTLTITEKGYQGEVEELVASEASTSAPALIALALARRRLAGAGAPVFASLDNLLDNGNVLRARVVDVAGRIDPSLAEWIAVRGPLPQLGGRSHGAGPHRAGRGGHLF